MKRVLKTDKIELVETYNLSLSLKRLSTIKGQYNDSATKRALYHALCMNYTFEENMRTQIRIALRLP